MNLEITNFVHNGSNNFIYFTTFSPHADDKKINYTELFVCLFLTKFIVIP